MTDDAAESRKRKEHELGEGDGGEEPAARSVKVTAIFDGEEELLEEIGDADLSEFMKILEDEVVSSATSSPGASFVTINGNEESCGSSFSVSDSTVMASVDTRDSRGGLPYFVGWAAACCSALRPAAPFIWPWPRATAPESGHSDGSAARSDGKAEELGKDEEGMVRDLDVVNEVFGSW